MRAHREIGGEDDPGQPDQAWWHSEAPLVLLEAAKETGLRFDVIDEGQDFEEIWIEVLKEICTSRTDSPFYVFADENQKLWNRDWEPDRQDSRLELTKNCRNARPISLRVAAIAESDLDDFGVDGPDAKWSDLNHHADVPALVQRIVEKLLREGFGKSDLVVLCESAPLAQQLRGTKVADTEFCTLGDPGIATETIGRFKGLEALAIILVLDRDPPELPDRNAYVGFSRARTYLHVVASPKRRAIVKWQ